MKKLVLGLLFVSVSFSSQAKVVAVASKVSGNAFFMSGGKTSMIKVGTHIPAQAEVFTEVGARLSLNDYYDHLYHLSGSGHVTIHRNLLELKSGYLWTQTKNFDRSFGPLRIVTPNAEISYEQGEGIISFDNALGKTQILSVKGTFYLKNSLEQYMATDVMEGKFSFIDGEYKNGKPRTPTAVGYGSFQKMTKLFAGVAPLSKRSHAFTREPEVHKPVKRSIASMMSSEAESNFEKALMKSKAVPTESVTKVPGKVIFVSHRERRLKKEAQQERLKLLNAYQNKIKKSKKIVKKWKPSYSKSSNVTVRVFGTKKTHTAQVAAAPKMVKTVENRKKITARRMPASVAPTAKKPVFKERSTNFESKLLKEYGKQMRHEKELNSLIDELQSVDADYKKNY